MEGLKEESVLVDIYQTSLCIVTRGAVGKGDFEQLQNGIQRIKGFIFSEKLSYRKDDYPYLKSSILGNIN
jgi:hypothetical protein